MQPNHLIERGFASLQLAHHILRPSPLRRHLHGGQRAKGLSSLFGGGGVGRGGKSG
jgi:hypothetical protein